MSAPDLSEFHTLGKTHGPKCAIALALQSIGEEASTLQAALGAEHITGSQIARWLARRGIKTSGTTVQRHRRRDCACDE